MKIGPVGGELIGIDTTALLLAGVQANSLWLIPVAILGSATFDATQVDPLTLSLDSRTVKTKGNGDPQTNIEDVNGDGFDDLVVKIIDSDGTYTVGTGSATLTGQLFDGTPIEGTDSIYITK